MLALLHTTQSLARRLPTIARSSSALSALKLSHHPLQIAVKPVLDQPNTLPTEHGTAVALLFEEDVTALAAEGGQDFTPLHAESIKGGKSNQVLEVFPGSKDGPSRLVVVGMGPRGNATQKGLQKAVHAGVQRLNQIGVSSAGIFVPGFPELQPEEVARCVTDVAIQSNYKWDVHKTDPSKRQERLADLSLLVSQSGDTLDSVRSTVQEQAVISHGTLLARDLGNSRANQLTLDSFEQVATELGSRHSSVHVSVVGIDEIKERGMGLIEAVGRAGPQPPRLVFIEHRGRPEEPENRVAVVGKGLLFDTGGLNIKPTGFMESMYLDKHGACTVLGVMHTVAELGIKANVVGVLALAENSVDSVSFRPSDILTSMKGLTVNVNNTDAEGRLVLADALTCTQKDFKGVHTILDLATLTGAIRIALGEHLCGLFTPSDALATQLGALGAETSEHVWRMPMLEEFDGELDHPECDLMSTGSGREGGSSTAAHFLHRFVDEGVDWAHLDIAGVAMLEKPRDWRTKNGTGWGVQLVTRWLQRHHSSDSKSA